MTWLEELPAAPVLLTGDARSLRAFHHTLLADAVHATDKVVLVLDGAHCIDPHQVGFAHLAHGCPADFGAGRVVIRRAMTPFQWDACMSEDLEAQLRALDVGLVLAAPLDAQILREEITDWEQEAYLEAHLGWARRLAGEYGVPVVWSVDLERFGRRAPLLAVRLREVVDVVRRVEVEGGGWRLGDQDGVVLERATMVQRRITDYLESPNLGVFHVALSRSLPGIMPSST